MPTIVIPHSEAGGERSGTARYDPHTGFFTCLTCGFELEGTALHEPCPCGGERWFDGGTLMVCDRQGKHVRDLTDPSPEDLAAQGSAVLARIQGGW